jgi:hypothetical protein
MKEKAISNEETIRKLIMTNLDNITKYHDNGKYFEKKFEEIRKKHAGKKVIVVDKTVKEVSAKVFDELRKKDKLAEAFISYVPKKHEIIML